LASEDDSGHNQPTRYEDRLPLRLFTQQLSKTYSMPRVARVVDEGLRLRRLCKVAYLQGHACSVRGAQGLRNARAKLTRSRKLIFWPHKIAPRARRLLRISAQANRS
jgi:hypothetical protein